MNRPRRVSLSHLVPLLLAAFACGCGGEAGKDGGSSPDRAAGAGSRASRGEAVSAATVRLYTLRNQAKLEADRDSDEGYRAAAVSLEEVVAEEPDGFVDRLNLARVLVFTDRAAEAGVHLEAARRLLGTDPVPADLDYIEGLYASRTADAEGALLHFTRTTEARPTHVQAWYQKGYAEERLQKFDDAAASYTRVLELDPENRAAAYRRVIVLRQLGQTAEAEEAFARFQQLPQEGQPDPEKCDLTQVSLVPMARLRAEPPESGLSWVDVTDSFGGAFEGFRSLHEWTAPNDSDVELAFLTESGATLQRVLTEGGLSGRNALPDRTGYAAPDLQVGDVDNDGTADLVIAGPQRLEFWMGRENGRFQPAPRAFASATPLRRFELWDLDHDGDLDVVGLLASGASSTDPAKGPLVWVRNNGDRTFAPAAQVAFESDEHVRKEGRSVEDAALARAATLDAVDFALHDLDQGNDLDLVVAGPRGTVALVNLRNGTFRPVSLPDVGALDFVRAQDLDNDGAPDLFGVTNGDQGAEWVRAVNLDPHGRVGEFRVGPVLRGSLPSAGGDVVLEDLDNDGDLDVLASDATGLGSLLNRRGGEFAVGPRFEVGENAHASGIGTTDVNNDGNVEIWFGTRIGSRVLEARNEKGYGAWRIRPKGARDNRDAVGLIVEQFQGVAYQSRIVQGPRGVRFGLATATPQALDGLRMRWPQGILQTEGRDELVLRAPYEFRPTQDEGLVASCPFLYVDGPDGWSFLTDVVGIAPLDEWLPPGAEPYLDPEEYVRIDGSLLEVRDGKLHLAITEELRETTYLDRVELVAVEHPAELDLYLDESTRQGAYDPLTVHCVRRSEMSPPLAVELERPDAVSTGDPLVLAGAVDGRYLHGYAAAPPQWSGWVERYAIDLVAPAGAGALFLTGRIGWYDSSVSYSLHQHGRGWGPLRLEEAGDVLVEDLGVPSGMDRTMVALLGDPSGEPRRLRLSGQHRFLWDAIRFAPAPEIVSLGAGDVVYPLESGGMLSSRRLILGGAELGFHGFSPMVGDRALHEQTYDYGAARPDDAFGPAWGRATRYGDVRPLLTDHDDEFVVIVAGDQVVLEFEAPESQETPADGRANPADESAGSDGGSVADLATETTYFLRVTGWAKEGSFHNLTGRWIEPLPYRDMAAYPPEAPRPSDADYQSYLDSYQTRVVRVP
ncbi:MAG: FG-GAP-like repeat-containing protein [Candidatus Eisenbacteria bacterium]